MKQPVFGIFERGGRVYTEIVPDAKKKTLQAVIRGKVALEATVVSDGWWGYDGLVDVGFDRHLRINKAYGHPTRFSENGVHINGIESFWSFTKRRLAKFNGVTTNFDGMSLSHYGFTASGQIHMRQDGDGSSDFDAICSSA